MKILFALTYFRPHISGLTIYVQRLAEALARRGHQVTVLTSCYNKTLPDRETLNGVSIVRIPILCRISKGVIMPGYLKVALPLLKAHDLLSIHLPNTPMETLLLSLLARYWVRRPITATYHCDVQLTKGLMNTLVEKVVYLSNLLTGLLAERMIAYTEDYANSSSVLRLFRKKREVIPPPIVVEGPSPASIATLRSIYAPRGERLIGFGARFAAEKGMEYLLKALPLIHKEIPNAKVLFAGEYQNVMGEESIRERLRPLMANFCDQWVFLGVLNPEQMAAFFGACDVTVLPSINRTESFGLVQVESMLCGTPVVATDLPGVRVPVRLTKMGRIVPPRNAEALATALIEVLRQPQAYMQPRDEIERHFSIEKTVRDYELLFERLIQRTGRSI